MTLQVPLRGRAYEFDGDFRSEQPGIRVTGVAQGGARHHLHAHRAFGHAEHRLQRQIRLPPGRLAEDLPISLIHSSGGACRLTRTGGPWTALGNLRGGRHDRPGFGPRELVLRCVMKFYSLLYFIYLACEGSG